MTHRLFENFRLIFEKCSSDSTLPDAAAKQPSSTSNGNPDVENESLFRNGRIGGRAGLSRRASVVSKQSSKGISRKSVSEAVESSEESSSEAASSSEEESDSGSGSE